MPRRSPPPEIDLVALYRNARRLDGKAFGAIAFAWLVEVFRFDRGLPLTSAAKRPAHVEASFHGFADPAALVASFGRVPHLDVLTPVTLARPGRGGTSHGAQPPAQQRRQARQPAPRRADRGDRRAGLTPSRQD